MKTAFNASLKKTILVARQRDDPLHVHGGHVGHFALLRAQAAVELWWVLSPAGNPIK